MKASSLGDMLRRSVRRFPDRVAMMNPEKGGFQEIRYRELYEQVKRYAGVLRRMGLARGDRLALISENAAEWAFLDWACQCLGVILVPIYPTLPADQAEYIVLDSNAKFVIAGAKDQFEKVNRIASVPARLLKGENSVDEEAAAQPGLSDEEIDREIDATQPRDIATFIYTSGTTGLPKGALLTHEGFVQVVHAVVSQIPVDENDVFLSFLPMSHVYERVAGQFLPIGMGACIGYAKSLASLAGDMTKVRPTILLCVPRFLESFRERALDGVKKLPPFRQKMFHFAMSQGVAKAQGKFAPFAGLLDKIVMGKLRERVGGRMRFFVSGGAALAPAVAEFYMGTGLNVLQGYGLTETSGGTCVNHPHRNKYWTVGEALGVELKIAEDGEILVRGAPVMVGYHNLPAETAAAIDADGWFHTGDIGEFEGKSLKITDRKKDLIVLGNGKNIAPQKIENRMRESELITEAVVFGDGMEHCIALIVPNAELVRKELNLAETVKLSENAEAKALIKREVEKVNKTMANFEAVKKFALLDNAFSVDSGEMTPTLKVKRKVVKGKYADILASLRN